MPVTGHAFVGVALASVVEPKRSASNLKKTFSPIAWMFLCLLLAYVPDIAEQLLMATRWSEAQAFSHSLPFAILATIILTFLLSATFKLDRFRTGLVAGFSIIGHDLLDVLHYADRELLWPFSPLHIGFAPLQTPTTRQELWIYVPIFALFVTWLIWKETRFDSRLLSNRSLQTRLASAALLLVVSSLLLLFAYRIRMQHEDYLERAHDLMLAKQYVAALEIVDKAREWPFPMPVAPVECLRGEIYENQGNMELAEQAFLRAYRSDPNYFWAVVDSAEFYSSASFPVEERRQRSAPYISKLRSGFDNIPERLQVLAYLERRLELPAGSLSVIGKPNHGD